MEKNTEEKHTMMDENLYWEIVNSSATYSPDSVKQLRCLVNDLKARPHDDIVGFMLRTHQLQQDLYTSDMWCACCLMNRGYCMEDGFEYFRSWIISGGKDTYYSAKANPDSLAVKLDTKIEFYDFQEFGYAPSYAFINKTGGKDIYSYLGDKFSFPKNPDINFNWNPDAPNTMKSICPELFEKMWCKNKYNPAATRINLPRLNKGTGKRYKR
jgi:hypothetical protein